ncbi:C39 family peptidase [Micromonospora sp. MED01]|uniref:C39 family peptidase n=1 Tax=Micromonospora alfalfae TaxID=2911212 RepID=UPI001EE99702|nr:C39 family peptidase [Micromonospora alfalfae]MCG5466591.1 C39 family peptidase [Micromonospora alfalfae]
MNNLVRWLPAITNTGSYVRGTVARSALGVAGLACLSAVAVGPAAAAQAVPSSAAGPAAAAQQADQRSTKSLEDYTFQAQPNIYYCGPASTRIALSAKGEIKSQDDLAGKLGTTVAGTASAFDITRVLNSELGKDVYKTGEIPTDTARPEEVQRLRTDLRKAIDEDRIPVVNVIGSAVDADNVQRSFPVGHYLTVVGYQDDGDMVKLADPWQPVGDGTYWIQVDELANWAASRGYSA